MASLGLTFDILARDNASRTFRSVGDSAERAGKQGEQAGSRIASGMKLAAGALLGGGIIAGFKALYEQAAESQRISRLTEQVVRSTGGAANVTARQVGELANAISRKTGIDDEAIQSGENLLLTFTGIRNEVGRGNDIFNQATSIVNDMSVALGQDMKSSAIQVGKALNDPIKGVTALQRVGVSFTASQREQIKVLVESGRTLDAQKLILAELGREFGGAAEAAATPLDKLKVTLGNLAEEAGGHLIPIVDGLANFLMDDLLPAARNLSPVFDAAGAVLREVADLAGDVLGFFNGLPGPVKATAVALGAVVLLKGPLSSFFSGLRGLADTAALKMLYLRDSVSSIPAATGALQKGASGLVGFLGGPWGLAITGATLGLGLLVDWLGKSDNATEESSQATRDYADALREANGVITDNVRQQAAKSAQDAGVLDIADRLGISLSTVTDAITGQGAALDTVRDRLGAYARSQQETVISGRAQSTTLNEQGQAALDALDALNRLAGQNGATATTEDQLARATAGAGTAAGAAVMSQEQLTTQLQDTADAAGEARSQTDLFKTSLDILTGANVSLIQAQSALEAAMDAGVAAAENLNGVILDQTGQFNLNNESARKVADVLFGVRDAGNNLISTMTQQGATEEEVRAQDAKLRASFIETARQMGIGQQEANKLADQILGIPSERNTTITADTAPARAAISGLINDYRGYTINLGLSANFNRFAAAAGGILPGFTPGRDVHRFMSAGGLQLDLSGGEAIMRPEWTRAVGPNFVGRMNKLARTGGTAAVRSAMGFAPGGVVPSDWLGGMLFRAAIDSGALASARSGMQNYARQFSGSFTSSVPGAPAATGGNQAIVQQLAASMYGWTGAQWNALYALIMKESGFRNTAQNPTSTAYGMFQFLDSTWAGYGVGKTSDPRLQTVAGLRYIASKYGSPSSALNFHLAHNWYDEGGWLQPGLTMAYNGTGKPERVRTAEQEAALHRPMELSDRTIDRLAMAMIRGAGTAISYGNYRQSVNARSS